jgi:SAM-dependent methyltransferase
LEEPEAFPDILDRASGSDDDAKSVQMRAVDGQQPDPIAALRPMSSTPEEQPAGQLPAAIERALETHRAHTDAAIASGDSSAIKQLYVELGVLLDDAIAGDASIAPLLSLPETGPVVLEMLGGIRGTFIDAGCGPNPAMSVALARDQLRTVVAMDIGFGIVRVARAVAERAGVRILPIVADLEALPFRNAAFDGGVCDDTVEHLPNDAQGIAELARVTSRKGSMVIATPNRYSAEVLQRKLRDRIRRNKQPASAYYAASSHLREYTWGWFERLLSPVFRVTARGSVGWPGGWKKRTATWLTSLPPFRRFGRMIVVKVEPRVRLGDQGRTP